VRREGLPKKYYYIIVNPNRPFYKPRRSTHKHVLKEHQELINNKLEKTQQKHQLIDL
jgi:hypothetical protein